MIHKNVRIAIQLQHKDDNISVNSGTIAYKPYSAKADSKVLYYANGSNEWLMFKDSGENTDNIKDVIDNIIDFGSGNKPSVRKINSVNVESTIPSLTFMYQFDDNGNAFYSEQVVDKWKDWMKYTHEHTKPMIICVQYGGVIMELTPMMHSKCVMTSVRLDGDTKDYKDIGELTEALIDRYVSIENNLTYRIVKLYDRCVKVLHDWKLKDVNQDAKLTALWSDLSDTDVKVEVTKQWIEENGIYQKPAPKDYVLMLSTSDPNYLYKYVFEEIMERDVSPVFYTTIATEKVTPVPMAELTHTRNGVLLDGFFSSDSPKTEVTTTSKKAVLWTDTVNAQFISNPSAPTIHSTGMFSDPYKSVESVEGSVSFEYLRDVPVNAFREMPWIIVSVECYDSRGVHIKTVDGVWELNGSTKLELNAYMLIGRQKFKADLNGGYAVKTKLKVFWGKFGSWTNEIRLCSFSVDSTAIGNGLWSVNDYIFNEQPNRVLTRCELVYASHNQSIMINNKDLGAGGSVEPNIVWNDNAIFGAPRGTVNWKANFYGVIYDQDGCNFDISDFDNLVRRSIINMKDQANYLDAHNRGILTSVSLSISYNGSETTENTETINIPYIYPPLDSDCTVMLRGGVDYRVISECQSIATRQVGIMKIISDVVVEKYKNVKYYGNDLIMTEDFIITGKNRSGYKLDVAGNPPINKRIASGAPDNDRSIVTRSKAFRRASSEPYVIKPKDETGMGLISRVNLVREFRLDEVRNKRMMIEETNGDISEFNFEYISDNKWSLLYVDKRRYKRVYGIIVDKIWLHVMTYHMNVKRVSIYNVESNTLEFILRDSITNEITHRYPLLVDKPEKYIPVEYDGKPYYIEMSDESSIADPVLIQDKIGNKLGYLK